MALEDYRNLYFFIGGPWNNRVVDLRRPDILQYRVVTLTPFSSFLDCDGVKLVPNVPPNVVQYTIDLSLPTGVKVLTCLFD